MAPVAVTFRPRMQSDLLSQKVFNIEGQEVGIGLSTKLVRISMDTRFKQFGKLYRVRYVRCILLRCRTLICLSSAAVATPHDPPPPCFAHVL